MSSNVLVINSGSSSLKYQVVNAASGVAKASGLIERIGESGSSVKHSTGDNSQITEIAIADHTQALDVMLDQFKTHGPSLAESQLVAVGHRVVQGGSFFAGPTLIDDSVVAKIEELAALAPLHQPAHLQGIKPAREIFADLPHIAVFDTAFHQTIPSHVATYALDREVARKYQVRRYGFHGTSHEYVSKTAAAHLGKAPSDFTGIVLHLGNGASATAIKNGASFDTTMGLTPLEGLVMGTRTGDIDPAVAFHLHRVAGMGIDDIDDLFNKKSGMLGLTGKRDMRDIETAANNGDQSAVDALNIYTYRLQKYIGAYYAALGPIDAIAFTAGIGENSHSVRAGALQGLEHLGIKLDEQANESADRGLREISAPDSAVKVLIVPTNEEWEIAQQSAAVVEAPSLSNKRLEPSAVK